MLPKHALYQAELHPDADRAPLHVRFSPLGASRENLLQCPHGAGPMADRVLLLLAQLTERLAQRRVQKDRIVRKTRVPAISKRDFPLQCLDYRILGAVRGNQMQRTNKTRAAIRAAR